MKEADQLSLLPLIEAADQNLAALRKQYLHLTKDILPKAASESARNWPVHEDHCFQRIVLDHICHGVWYDHLQKPAYKHMSSDQLADAIALCEKIASNSVDLRALNKQSLVWRGKA